MVQAKLLLVEIKVKKNRKRKHAERIVAFTTAPLICYDNIGDSAEFRFQNYVDNFMCVKRTHSQKKVKILNKEHTIAPLLFKMFK